MIVCILCLDLPSFLYEEEPIKSAVLPSRSILSSSSSSVESQKKGKIPFTRQSSICNRKSRICGQALRERLYRKMNGYPLSTTTTTMTSTSTHPIQQPISVMVSPLDMSMSFTHPFQF